MDWGHWIPPIGATEIPEGSLGFMYIITNKLSGQYYIGIKQLSSKVTKKPLKGKTRNRISKKESDWKTYCSSSGKISEDISENKQKYKFEILSFHESKTTLKIAETKKILDNMYDDLCLNQMINLRVNIAHIKKK